MVHQRRRTYCQWHGPDSDDADDLLCFCPFLTCYFAFSLDHIASVDFLDDPEATSAAQKINGGTYIGLAERTLDLPLPDRPLHRMRIRLLSQGLPSGEDLERRCVQAAMCLPISPATQHPTGRLPVIPSKPFPWDNIYHHSPMFTILRIPTRTQDYSAAIFSSHQDMSRLRRAWNEDETERKALLEAAQFYNVDGMLLYPD
ncbi:uncharacterized protein STEHIDRAFT_64420 [Stereum hirsutum FP-91666 SS1]|uniref:uncharacterized protein n=1 Tax=Stereum hirsutum (strain FP-91666) TaxID=721885 RepID=UPI000444A5BB|nr:uncharacterized protein STEHIDRAFT_64420 [Stereum hirsutum FP-91666 SS1]EIM82937.1 hypothetical protein STEHIDRAFT_64420 [Stereum hirsutum FP-91666 SS1]